MKLDKYLNEDIRFSGMNQYSTDTKNALKRFEAKFKKLSPTSNINKIIDELNEIMDSAYLDGYEKAENDAKEE